jgi:hypothetical protein
MAAAMVLLVLRVRSPLQEISSPASGGGVIDLVHPADGAQRASDHRRYRCAPLEFRGIARIGPVR